MVVALADVVSAVAAKVVVTPVALGVVVVVVAVYGANKIQRLKIFNCQNSSQFPSQLRKPRTTRPRLLQKEGCNIVLIR